MTSSSPPGAARGKAGPAPPRQGRNAGKPAGASTARRELVENEIYEHAIRLFAERGFAGTSLQDIADALGVTRPALYYYVKSKDELLAKLAADVARIAALGVIGMWNWVAWWFRPGRDSAEAVADELADMAIAALQRADHRIPDGEGPAAALKMLRQDLDHLERILDI